MAAFSAPALGVCQAMQEEAINAIQPSAPLVQTAQPYQAGGGAFNAVRSAQPQVSYQEMTQLPPIVPGNASMLPPEGNSSSTLPPIVTSSQLQQAQLPATSTGQTQVPSAYQPQTPVAQSTAPQPKSNGMLAPIAVHENQPVVAQATAAPIDAVDDSQVTPVAKWQQSANRAPAHLAQGFSAAGVPLYASASSTQETSPESQQSAPILDSEINAAPEITSDSQIITPLEEATPDTGQVTSAEQPQQTVENYQTQSPTYFDTPTAGAPPANGYGCPSCGGAGCSACAGRTPTSGQSFADDSPIGQGLDFGDYRENEFNGQFDVVGSVANARTYFTFDLQYMDRADGDINLTNFGALGTWDQGYGARITIGRRNDATRGREISYWGTNKLDASSLVQDPDGNLNPLFITDPIFSGDETSPFFNSVEYFQQKSTYFHSFEFNRVKWGWDVVKSFVGFRAIYFDDQYGIFSENIAGETGTFTLDAQNILIGAHIGREMFYDVGYRWSLSGFFKAGVYVNASQFEIDAAKLGVPFLDLESNNTTIAGTLEFGIMSHYEITRRSRFRFGYNVIWFGNVSTVADNLPTVFSPFIGENISDSDDATFQGLFFGLELFN